MLMMAMKQQCNTACIAGARQQQQHIGNVMQVPAHQMVQQWNLWQTAVAAMAIVIIDCVVLWGRSMVAGAMAVVVGSGCSGC
jgi:hypothetical protein